MARRSSLAWTSSRRGESARQEDELGAIIAKPETFLADPPREEFARGMHKDIRGVMAAQTDLVDVLGEFRPRIVKMCPAGPAED